MVNKNDKAEKEQVRLKNYSGILKCVYMLIIHAELRETTLTEVVLTCLGFIGPCRC